MDKIFKILTYSWLVLAVVSACMAVYFLSIKDTDNALFFIFAFLISAVLFLLRRYQLKKHQAQINAQNKKK
ncbi:MAG: hypothetical protein JST26_11140 [Bacteroidetes bacterium]|nr:hypothetical protein [Bacteroidota bacterium]